MKRPPQLTPSDRPRGSPLWGILAKLLGWGLAAACVWLLMTISPWLL